MRKRAKFKLWSEIRTPHDMNKYQWQLFKKRLADALSGRREELRERLAFNETSMNNLEALRDRANRPGKNFPGSLKRKMSQLLQFLSLTDEELKLPEDRVYIAPASVESGVPYVGRGSNRRIARYSGHLMDTFRATDSICLQCLESVLIWLARVGRFKLGNDKEVRPCGQCAIDDSFRILGSSLEGRIGRILTRDEFIEIAANVSTHERL